MYLVFDIGGTNTRIAVSKDAKTFSQSETIPTEKDFEAGIQAIKKVSMELSGGQKIKSVAGSIASPLDYTKTMLVGTPNSFKTIGNWDGKPLKVRLEEVFGVNVILENDALVEGLGEVTLGAGIGKNIVAFVTIGTGVGGVRLISGKVDQYALGFEIGHQIIVMDGNICGCEGKGHLESYVSGAAIERIYGEKAELIKDPKVWEEVAKYLSVGLNNVVVHWSPDIVILGGSVSNSIPMNLVKSNLGELLKVFPQIPEVVQGSLGDEAGLYGALELIKQNY